MAVERWSVGLCWALLAACALAPAPAPVPSVTPPPPAAPPVTAATSSSAVRLASKTGSEVCLTATVAAALTPEDDDDSASEENANGVSEEEEVIVGAADARLRYTLDLSEEKLTELWRAKPEALGSISAGFAHEGRLINGVRMPEPTDGAWMVVLPSFGTEETITYIETVARTVKAEHPNALPLRVNMISARDGGYVRPHRSHQNGRDVDFGFYYPVDPPPRVREREKVIDVDANWSLLKAIATRADAQVVLVDRRVQAVLRAHALASGEDPAFVASMFGGPTALVQHARRHRDHFHVRFYNPRAQELGHRIAPLLALRPEHNIAIARIKSGDTLGHLALRYNTTIRMIQKQNRMRGTFLRIGQVVQIPLRGPCNRCPVPPIIEVPSRRVAPARPLPEALATVTTTTATVAALRE